MRWTSQCIIHSPDPRMTDGPTIIPAKQYQYQGDNWWLTLRGSYIREFQRFDASFI
jgi:hypothetical protein